MQVHICAPLHSHANTGVHTYTHANTHVHTVLLCQPQGSVLQPTHTIRGQRKRSSSSNPVSSNSKASPWSLSLVEFRDI